MPEFVNTFKEGDRVRGKVGRGWHHQTGTIESIDGLFCRVREDKEGSPVISWHCDNLMLNAEPEVEFDSEEPQSLHDWLSKNND